MIDDVDRLISDIYPLISARIKKNPFLVISLKMDRQTPMHALYNVQEELRKANALKINFCTEFLK